MIYGNTRSVEQTLPKWYSLLNGFVMKETLNSIETKWNQNMHAGLMPDRYVLSRQGDVQQLEIGCDSYQSYSGEPPELKNALESSEEDQARLRQFDTEVRNGALTVTESITGSVYGVACLNQDFREYPGWEDRNAMLVSLPFTSSVSADQGREALWQISQRFPRNLVIAVGNEGTPDVRINREWLRKDLQELTDIRHQCLHEALREHGAVDENDMPRLGIDLVGQSMGAMFSLELAKHLQQKHVYGTPVERAILISPPVNYCNTLQLANDVLRQETGSLLRSDPEERARIINHLNEHILPWILGKDAVRKLLGGEEVLNIRALHHLTKIIAQTHMRAEDLDGTGVDMTFIAGSEDKLSPPDDFLESKRSAYSDSGASKSIRAIIASNEKHSNWLLNEMLCGRVIETAFRWDEMVGAAATEHLEHKLA